jgi:hypothetical protein
MESQMEVLAERMHPVILTIITKQNDFEILPFQMGLIHGPVPKDIEAKAPGWRWNRGGGGEDGRVLTGLVTTEGGGGG